MRLSVSFYIVPLSAWKGDSAPLPGDEPVSHQKQVSGLVFDRRYFYAINRY